MYGTKRGIVQRLVIMNGLRCTEMIGGIDDGTWINSVHRGLFRLHPGRISEGCITIPHNSDYARIKNALMNSSPGTNSLYEIS